MWIISNGRLVHTTDESRISFRTTLCKSILNELEDLAEKHNTHINYLLETGFINVLKQEKIDYNKMPRVNPKNRIRYSTTYDKELIDSIRDFAKKEFIHINQLIEYSAQFVDTKASKYKDYRYRIDRD